MRWVRAVTERIQKQHIQSAQPLQRRFRNLAVIRQIRNVAEAIPIDYVATVAERDGLEANARGFKGTVINDVDFELRDAGLAVAFIEYVGENTLNCRERIRRCINRDFSALMIVKRSDIIEAEDVVGV